jgi:3-dehydroquinate dehydratase-2
VARPVILLLSGPNLNLLGDREPEIYGTQTLMDHVSSARDRAQEKGFDLEHVQSNHEGDLIDAIHAARKRVASIVINAGALTHYSWSLHDALSAYDGPVIELHLSDPKNREPWRHLSVIEPVAFSSVSGKGGAGYTEAIDIAINACNDGDA